MCYVLFAWSWGGHGELTTLGAAIAIARLAFTAKPETLKTLCAYAKGLRSGIPFGLLPGVKAIETGVGANQKGSVSDTERELAGMFRNLPRKVQTEDIHRGNIPYIGHYLQGDSQVRHFMRSDDSVNGIDAYDKSRAYIREHLLKAFDLFQKSMVDGALSTYIDAQDELAAALHTLQDSYAPGHVSRMDTTFFITEVHIWDAANRDGDPSRGIPTHEEYDEPTNPKSIPFFNEAKNTTANFIETVLANMDQTPGDFSRAVDRLLASSLSVILTSKMY